MKTVRSRWLIGLALAGAALALLAGCGGGSGEDVVGSLEELPGVWHRTVIPAGYGELFIAFDPDGSYRVATGSAGRKDTHPIGKGKAWFEEGHLRMTDEIDSETWPACLGSGEVGTYEVQRAEDGTIAFVLAGEPCGGGARGKVLTGSFELVS